MLIRDWLCHWRKSNRSSRTTSLTNKAHRRRTDKKRRFPSAAESLEDRLYLSATVWQAVADSALTADTNAAPTAESLWYVPNGGDPSATDAGQEVLDLNGEGLSRAANAYWAQPDGPGSTVTITYSYSNLLDGGFSTNLSNEEIRATIEEALSIWSTVAPLNFVEIADIGPDPSVADYSVTAATADIRFGYRSIDGTTGSNILAQTFFPTNTLQSGLAGDIHFDGDNIWSTDPDQGADLLEVSVHEIGHALGLDHELLPTQGGTDAVMNPVYAGRYDGLGTAYLLTDDVSEIRSVYGAGGGRVIPLAAHFLTIGSGDASLTVGVDGFGAFGSVVGTDSSDAVYDPVGAKPSAGTVFESGIALAFTGDATRQFLTSGSIGASGGLTNPTITGNSATASSSFTVGVLSFTLTQTLEERFDANGQSAGTFLTQTYTFTNTDTNNANFELIRYIDGDLLFDGTLVDGGGYLVSNNGQEVLFETDAGGTGDTDTTFFGITADGGTALSSNRYQIDYFSGLRDDIISGLALTDTVRNDFDNDGFVDAGSEYDVTLALRTAYTLAPGASDTLTTETVWGTGAPEELGDINADDHGNNAGEATILTAGLSNNGEIEQPGDVDWFRLQLNAGTNYRFETRTDSLSDTFLTLYGPDGTTILALDDDSGRGRGSLIDFTPQSSGTYHIEVSAFSPAGTGTYNLLTSVIDETPLSAATPLTPLSSSNDLTPTFSWSAVDGASYYLLRVDDITLGAAQNKVIDEVVQDTTFTPATDLISNHSYRWTVTAVSPSGVVGPSSVAVQFTASNPGDDYGDSPVAANTLRPGSWEGSFETSGDEDWFVFNATAGQNYIFDLDNYPNLPFATITLYDDHVQNLSDVDSTLTAQIGGFFSYGEYEPSTGTYGFVVDPTSGAHVQALDTMLATAMTNNGTTLEVVNRAAMPDPRNASIGSYKIRIQNEILLVTDYNPQNQQYTVTRGVDGTAAVAHSVGRMVMLGDATTSYQSTFYVDDASAFPTTPGFTIDIEGEHMLVTAIDAVNPRLFTVNRATDGTTRIPHTLTNQVGLTPILPLSVAVLQVADGTAFPSTPGYRVRVNNETFWVTNVSGNSLTVLRAYDNTHEGLHQIGDTVTLMLGSQSGIYGSPSISGNPLTFADPNVGSIENGPELHWTPTVSGTYFLKIDASGLTGDYTLNVTGPEPDDHGDTAGTATTVAVGSSTDGDIHWFGDVDWFRIDATDGETYIFETVLRSNPDTYITLYAADGTTVLATDDDSGTGRASRIEYTANSTGALYVVVEGFDLKRGTYDFNVSQPIPDDHGNQHTSATPMVVGTPVAGNIEQPGDEDWFHFNGYAGTTYVLEALGNSLADPTLTLFEQDGTTILDFDDDSGAGANAKLIFSPTVDGIYFLKAEAFDMNATGTYNVSILTSDYDDHGNNYTTATAVTVGDTVLGNIEKSGDTDWFSFNGLGGSDYVIETVLGTLADSQITLYAADGTTVIATNDNGGQGAASRLTFSPVSNATYFVKVDTPVGVEIGSYQLSVQSVIDDHGDTPGTATAAVMNSSVAGNIEVPRDVDLISFNADAGVFYSFELIRNTLPAARLTLIDDDGSTVLVVDDDGGKGQSPSIDWLAPITGTYYLKVESIGSAQTGTYTVNLSQPVKVNIGTPSQILPTGPLATTKTPTFAWTETEFAVSYDVWVNDLTTGERRVFEATGVTNTQVTATDPLVEGHVYRWFVQAFAANGLSSPVSKGQTFVIQTGDDHGDDASTATVIPGTGMVAGNIEIGQDVDYFQFDAVAGRTYEISTTLSTLPNSILSLLGTDGTTVLQSDNDSAMLFANVMNGTVTSAFPAVGIVGSTTYGGYGSGTLIASNYVLTCGHCAVLNGTQLNANEGIFVIGGVTYQTSNVYVHPGYNPNTLANDIAIFELSQDVVGITPDEIYRSVPFVGQTLTIVGYGATGTGASGHDSSFGVKRVGQTTLEGVTSTLITWNFDSEAESNTAPGDSGGPGYVTVGGERYIAGITSGGSQADAGLGDFSFDTRVDAFQTWIDSIVPANTTPTPSGPRITFTPTVSGTYYVTMAPAVSTQSGTYTLSVTESSSMLSAGAVTRDAAPIADITATTGDDVIDIQITDTGFVIEINGSSQTYDFASVSTLNVHASEGNDSVTIHGTDGAESAILRQGSTTVTGAGFTLNVGGVEDIEVLGGGGVDEVTFLDSLGDDAFTSSPLSARMVGTGFENFAIGFERIVAQSNNGTDSATLFDSAGDDTLIAEANKVVLKGSGFSTTVNNFETTTTNAANGGYDSAFLFDSAGDDQFSSGQVTSRMTGDGFDNQARLFEKVMAQATGGGVDTAHLYDSAGDDTFVATQGLARMSNADSTVKAFYFENVVGHAVNGGNDTAHLHDSAGNDEFVAGPTTARMSGDGFLFKAEQFESVIGYSINGGTDIARLHDSAGDDAFIASPQAARMVGEGYYNLAKEFDAVYAYANSGGNDTAHLHDSSGNDRYVGTAERGTMSGDGFSNSAYRFDVVTAYSIHGGTDSASLYDSAGDDRFISSTQLSRVEGTGFYNSAREFEAVQVYAINGGYDQAFLYDSAGDDTFRSLTGRSKLVGTGFDITATGFDRVYAYAINGGNDQAIFNEARTGETLYGRDNIALLSRNDGSTQRAQGFVNVTANAAESATPTANVLDVDYVFEQVGDWV